jgi:hypothetical protein
MKSSGSACALFSAIALIATSVSAVPVQWTVASGGNGNFYDRVDVTGLTFDQAKSAAEALSFSGFGGRLAVFETANYANEFNFVDTNVYAPAAVSNRIYWVGASRPASANAFTQDWSWVDGQPVPTSITGTWNLDQFEGSGTTTPYGAGFFIPSSHQLWDYAKSNPSSFTSGYIVEYQTPEPAALAPLGAAAVALLARGACGRRRAARAA